MLYKNLSNQKIYVYVYNKVTGEPVTGAASAITGKASKDGAAFSALTNTPSELEGGIYYISLSQAETNADAIAVIFTSSNATYAAAPQIFYTSDSVATVSLASTGLDAVSVTMPSGPATTFREMLVLLYERYFGKSEISAAGGIKVYATDNATVITTQTVSDNGTTQTIGAAS